jgi:plasmid stabilization system protein ParE
MKVLFLSPALHELEDAFNWYQNQMHGLGHDFLDEIDEGIRRIISWPRMHTPAGNNFRRCLIRKFPYGLIYEFEEDAVVVLAVAHLHRRPFYWSRRKRNRGDFS